MNSTSDFTIDLFDVIPTGLIKIDSGLTVLDINSFAKSLLDLTQGQSLTSAIHPDSRQEFDKALDLPGQEHLVQFQKGQDSLYTQLSSLESTGAEERVLVFRDISEQMVLSARLRKSKEPERKFVHDLSNAMTTTVGYSELINLMLEEEPTLSGDRLQTVIKYQAEVYAGLLRANKLITSQRQGRQISDQVTVPLKRKHIIVVDDEPTITEFLAELMRGIHHKVTAFNDSHEALEFYKNNVSAVDLVIVDQIMPGMSGIALATELLALNMELPIVLCTGDQELISDQISGRLKIKHFVRKPIDIDEISDIVTGIFN